MTLSKYREQINAIDKSLLLLVKTRQEAAQEIGRLKKANNVPVFDVKREVNLIKENVEFSKALGLGTELAKDLTKVLMFHSKVLQEKVSL